MRLNCKVDHFNTITLTAFEADLGLTKCYKEQRRTVWLICWPHVPKLCLTRLREQQVVSLNRLQPHVYHRKPPRHLQYHRQNHSPTPVLPTPVSQTTNTYLQLCSTRLLDLHHVNLKGEECNNYYSLTLDVIVGTVLSLSLASYYYVLVLCHVLHV